MFLSSATVTNVQKLFNAESLCTPVVKILDIYSQRSQVHIRFLMDGDECVVAMHMEPGHKLHIVLDDHIRWSAYYRMEEIRNGKEVDEGVDNIVAIWPEDTGPLVVVELKRTEQPSSVVVHRPSNESLDALQEKFGSGRKIRRG